MTKPQSATKQIHLTVTLSNDEVEKIRRIAKAQGCSLHQLLSIQLTTAISDLDEFVKDKDDD